MQSSYRAVGEVIDGIGVGFEDADGVAYFFGEGEELVGCVDVGRDAEVGVFDGNEAVEVAKEG